MAKRINISKLSDRETYFGLFLVSFLALFLEISFIRWIPAYVSAMAYFNNIILIACLFGLGAGCLISEHRVKLIYYFPLLLFVCIYLVLYLSKFKIIPLGAEKEVLYWRTFFSSFKNIRMFYVLTPLFFVLTSVFIPLGQEIGKRIRFSSPLKGYSVNILGSLLGIIVFSSLSFLNTYPPVWFGISFLIALYFLQKKWRFFILGVICALFVLVAVVGVEKSDVWTTFWSPYYMIRTSPMGIVSGDLFSFERASGSDDIHVSPVEMESEDRDEVKGIKLYVNRFFFQVAMRYRDLLNFFNIGDKFIQESKKFLEGLSSPKEILILGTGLGDGINRTLHSLKDIHHIDAVEIDPVIVELGKRYHPEHPYQDPRVSVYVDDARSYIKKSKKKYDIVVLEGLDAHRLVSAKANIRLDSYIYTLESFQEIKRILKDNSALYLTFGRGGNNWVIPRLNNMIKSALGVIPYYSEQKFNYSVTLSYFVARLGSNLEDKNFDYFRRISFPDKKIEIPTDDWPFLYTRQRKIPAEYISVFLVIFVLALTFTFLAKPEARRISPLFFILGSSFMLLETKSITQLSLLFGATWIVSSIVIGSILFAILLANIYVISEKGIKKIKFYYLLLFISLLLNYYVPLGTFLKENMFIKILISTALISLPIVFAGVIFALLFKSTTHPHISFGSNIIGMVFGGFCEYLSLIIGFRNLTLFILILYIISYLGIKLKPIRLERSFVIEKSALI